MKSGRLVGGLPLSLATNAAAVLQVPELRQQALVDALALFEAMLTVAGGIVKATAAAPTAIDVVAIVGAS